MEIITGVAVAVIGTVIIAVGGWFFRDRLGWFRPRVASGDEKRVQRDEIRDALLRIIGDAKTERNITRRIDQAVLGGKATRAQVEATDACLEDRVVRVGCLVVAGFGPEPSRTWSDPSCRVLGLWDGKKGRTVLLEPPLTVESVSVGLLRTTHRPLCIPSYDVDVEWREETHVKGPLWGPVKRYVVKRFLEECQGTEAVCYVAYVGDEGQFHLHNYDYDAYLQNEWSYFKALEAALSINELYKNEEIIAMSHVELRNFVEENLTSVHLEELISPRFRQTLAWRSLDADAVDLVLRGLIDRYKQLITRS